MQSIFCWARQSSSAAAETCKKVLFLCQASSFQNDDSFLNIFFFPVLPSTRKKLLPIFEIVREVEKVSTTRKMRKKFQFSSLTTIGQFFFCTKAPLPDLQFATISWGELFPVSIKAPKLSVSREAGKTGFCWETSFGNLDDSPGIQIVSHVIIWCWKKLHLDLSRSFFVRHDSRLWTGKF